MSRSRRLVVLVAAALGLALAGASAFAALHASVPDAKGNIRSCYDRSDGDLRVLVSGSCKADERKLVWSQRVRKPKLRLVGSAGVPYVGEWKPTTEGFDFQDLAFYRDASRIVRLTGTACQKFGGSCQNVSVQINTGDTVFTLPAGFRPARHLIFSTMSFGASKTFHTRVDVYPNGNVVVWAPPEYGARFVTFDGIAFLTK